MEPRPGLSCFFFAQGDGYHSRYKGLIRKRFAPLFKGNGKKPAEVDIEIPAGNHIRDKIDEINEELYTLTKGLASEEKLILEGTTEEYYGRLLVMVREAERMKKEYESQK